MKRLIRVISVILLIVCSYVFTNIYYLTESTPNIIFSDKRTITLTDEDIKCSVSNINGSSENYELKFFNIFPVKNIKIKNNDIKKVVLCGNQFGIKIYSSGSIVTSISGVLTENGCKNPAYDSGIRKGDVILSINDEPISCNSDIERIVKNSDEKLKIVYERNDKKYTTTAYSVICAADNSKKLGMWIKDSIAGIGTSTFYIKETGIAAGLGHGVYDNETNLLMPLSDGAVCGVDNYVVSRSSDGIIGDISGNLSSENCGKIIKNSDNGVYFSGVEYDGKMVDIGHSSEIKIGNAQIYLSLNGEECRYYDCVIEKIKYNDKSKNLIIRITDKELLDKTGGIIQGMSGSPIIQNNKLIGAVTHVLVNDSTSGYGIFIENMLETALDCS